MDEERAKHLAFMGNVDAMRDMTRRAPRTVVHDEGGVVLIAGPHWLPVLINCAARTDPDVAPGDVLERAAEFFDARKRGFTVLGESGRDEDLMAAAESAGLVSFGEPAPLMAVEEPPETAHTPEGMRIERVTTAADVEALVGVCADAYSVYGMPDDVPIAAMPPAALLAPHIAAYLVMDDEGPVATATALNTHGTAYLQWVGTRQRAFGRGAGPAVTEAATIGGFELGASLATLVASPMGAPVYRRLGWSDVGVLDSRVAFTTPT